MGSVTRNEVPAEAAMMGALWNLIKRFYIPETTEEYWKELQCECEKLYRDYPLPLTKYLLNGYRDFLQEKEMGGKK